MRRYVQRFVAVCLSELALAFLRGVGDMSHEEDGVRRLVVDEVIKRVIDGDRRLRLCRSVRGLCAHHPRCRRCLRAVFVHGDGCGFKDAGDFVHVAYVRSKVSVV